MTKRVPLTPQKVKEVAAYYGGELVGTGTMHQMSELTGTNYKTIGNHVVYGGATKTGYTFEYTGQMIDNIDPPAGKCGRPPGFRIQKEPPKKKRGKSLAKVAAEARAAGMTYGQYVGLKGIK